VAPGEYRAAVSFSTDTTAPLLTIADLSTVWVTADVAEPFLRLVHVGQPVAVSLVSFPDEVFNGSVSRIGDVLDPQTRTLKVTVDLPNPGGRFRPEMFGSIRQPGPRRPLPVLSPDAVVLEYGRPVVFVERAPGRFERIEAYPDLTDPTVVVVTLYPGFAAEEVEQQVTVPIERALNNTPYVISRRSRTIFGLSVVELTFEDGTNDFLGRQLVLERLQGAQLPDGVTPTLGPLSGGVSGFYRYVVA